MKPFSVKKHRNALVRRRIKFVVEKGAMARLFRSGTSAELQEEIYRHLKPSTLARLETCDEYDTWLLGIIKLRRWQNFSRYGLKQDRWAYFAKLLNIIIYEIV